MMVSGVHASLMDSPVRGNESLPPLKDRQVGCARRPKLLDQLRESLRSRHYSSRTEQTYCHWVRRYIHFHNIRHPAEMAEQEINAFLTHLATKEKVSASTQNQALSALHFLYRHVIGREVGDLGEVFRARKPKRLPVVMTREEVKGVLTNLTGDKWLMASLMYSAGLRLMECLRLRVQDIDFSRNEILVPEDKGAKDRITMLPESLKAPLQQHLKTVKAIHERNLADGWGRVLLPDALDRKYPSVPKEWRRNGSFRRKTAGKALRRAKRRHHVHESIIQKAVNGAEKRPTWPNGPPATHSVIPSPRNSWNRATTSGQFRNFSVTRTSRLR
jgi:integron integrase